jgi:ketosteroid isomerase-like protein
MSIVTTKEHISNDESEIRGLLMDGGNAHHEKDAAAIAALYATDAVVADLAPPLIHSGVGREQKQSWLDTWEGPIERESRDFTFDISGDLAVGHGYFRLAGTPKAAGRPISFWMRATVCLRRRGGRWLIVHEHTSVPFYMDGSLRPAFDLEP